MCKFIDINGEAIYGTSAWTRYGEGPFHAAPEPAWVAPGPDDPINESYTNKEIRFTTNGDTLFASVMDWPGDQALITSLATGKVPQGKIEKVELLGNTGVLQFTQDEGGLKVKMPAQKPCDFAYSLKITGLKLK